MVKTYLKSIFHAKSYQTKTKMNWLVPYGRNQHEIVGDA